MSTSLEPKVTPILCDRRVMGVYAGLSPERGAAKLLQVHDGNRKNALTVANRRSATHEIADVRWWWKHVAERLEAMPDQLLRQECAWCRKELRAGVEPTSHGICTECSVAVLAEETT